MAFLKIPKTAKEALAKAKESETHNKKDEEKMSRFDSVFTICLVVSVVVLGFIKFVLNPIVISGTSMEPTLHNREIYFTDGFVTEEKLKNGTIIVFRANQKTRHNYIKRIEGIPGDTVQIVGGVLYRNGEKVVEPYSEMWDAGEFSEAVTIPEDKYFVLGDNRNNSNDSRILGLIDRKDIVSIVSTKRRWTLPS